MNNINYAKMFKEEVQQRLQYGRTHLDFRLQLYEVQWREGRYFLHGHPQNASSWQESGGKRLLARAGVQRVVGDQCVYGLKTKDGERPGPARKSIGFLTDSPCIAQALRRRCPNTTGTRVHDHMILEGSSTKAAQVHPPGLCRAICQGFQAQM